MSKQAFSQYRKAMHSMAMFVGVIAAALSLAACAPAYNTRPGGYHGRPSSSSYYGGNRQCYQGCGYVRDIRQVQLSNRNGAVLGTVIGALVGGALGNQVGGGSGKTAATIAGAIGGGVAGHAIGQNAGRGDVGWRIVVELGNGQYATVTQRDPPQVRVGDYVMVRNNEVYRY